MEESKPMLRWYITYKLYLNFIMRCITIHLVILLHLYCRKTSGSQWSSRNKLRYIICIQYNVYIWQWYSISNMLLPRMCIHSIGTHLSIILLPTWSSSTIMYHLYINCIILYYYSTILMFYALRVWGRNTII